MPIKTILADKSLKSSEQTVQLSQLLLENPFLLKELLQLAEQSRDPGKGTLIEALEHASLKNPALVDAEAFLFVTGTLASKAPRVKWESARVISNVAHLHHDRLETAIPNLLTNTEHPGTVVRWSAATALSAILLQKLPLNNYLVPALVPILEREEKNSIRKIYQAALTKTGNQGLLK